MNYALDQATHLTVINDDRYNVTLDQRFWNVRSAFGGWVGAVCAEAVQRHREFRFAIVTQQINFHAAVRSESLVVSVRLIERRRTMDFWQIDVSPSDQPERVDASATIVCGEQEATQIGYETDMPEHRAVADCVRLPSGDSTPNWFEHFDIRLAKGRPFSMNQTANSATYVREADGRQLDAKALLAISDTPMPRTFFRANSMTFAATISLSTYVYASESELTEVGTGYLLLDTQCKVIRHGFLNQETYLYREDGLLLATSYQTGRFRE
ncbi:MAG: thioesterase family protein [Pseudomonadota bacterium]